MSASVPCLGHDRHPRRFFNPFCWMNPLAIASTVTNAAPGVLGLMRSALAA